MKKYIKVVGEIGRFDMEGYDLTVIEAEDIKEAIAIGIDEMVLEDARHVMSGIDNPNPTDDELIEVDADGKWASCLGGENHIVYLAELPEEQTGRVVVGFAVEDGSAAYFNDYAISEVEEIQYAVNLHEYEGYAFGHACDGNHTYFVFDVEDFV